MMCWHRWGLWKVIREVSYEDTKRITFLQQRDCTKCGRRQVSWAKRGGKQ